MSSLYRLRRAEPADVPALVALRREAEQWLAGRGIEQWTAKWTTVGAEKLERATRQGRAWLVEADVGDVAGTVTLGGPDEDLWRIEDGPALYLYKLMVARRHGGRGLGGLLIDWVCDQAVSHGYPAVRLDIWPNNHALGAYYERHGFRHVRTVDVPGRDTGALYERPARAAQAERLAMLAV
ncbi:GNAT family N-acetyltransferase [Actinomadura nitritigenes]|jgi:ribosomal protein S18 acetylase RimI-like enzyme|uniref:GNAT family N-acetyltransferase n=1 Tax=Actinomadura nitritigenes TaxID=134602 RepID=UPI0036A61D70